MDQMVGVVGPEPDHRGVVMVEPPALSVAVRQLQSFFPPQAFDLLVVDAPALCLQQLADLAIAVATITQRGKTDQEAKRSVS